ncbi:hypothetical protein J3R82DRAFT_7611 [Butyriboletus roseoflavus]|nr:hypothetical protein J3R82DRAFT_7611 [Butyriboletus roseoflavus]
MRPPEANNTVNTLAPGSKAGPKQTREVLNINATMSDAESDADSPFKKKKKDRIASQANGAVCDGTLTTGPDSLLKDVQVIDVDEPTKRGQAKCTQDIDAHFSTPYLNLDNKKVWDCNTCSKQLKKCVAIVDQTTTLRRHQQAAHEKMYWKWAADNGFTSMLPMDTKHH